MIILSMIIGNILYLNPIVSEIYSSYEGHPSMKSMDEFGGVFIWILITLLFGVILEIFFIILYLILYESISGKGWKKGLSFGLIISTIKAIPEAFNQYMIFNYPTILIIIQLVNTIVGLILFGVLMSVIFEKIEVIQKIGE